jgi:hypothetical protein
MQDIKDEVNNPIWRELGIGLYSIHLVHLSIATKTWVKPSGAVVKGPIISRLQQANGQDGSMVMRF